MFAYLVHAFGSVSRKEGVEKEIERIDYYSLALRNSPHKVQSCRTLWPWQSKRAFPCICPCVKYGVAIATRLCDVDLNNASRQS